MIALTRLVGEHRAAFEYDWRSRIHMPLSSVGGSMSWGEAVRLTQVLARDPSSAVCAALQRWDHPLSREVLVLLDLFDLYVQSHHGKGPKPKPHPMRPVSENRERLGRMGGRTVEQVKAILLATRASG